MDEEDKEEARKRWRGWEGLWLLGEKDKLSFTGATTKSFSNRCTRKTNNRWRPFSSLDLNNAFSPLKTMETTANYTEIDDYKETTGSKLRIFTKIWPDLIMNIGDIEKFFSLDSKIICDSQLAINYSHKTIETEDVSRDINKTYGGDLRFDVFTKYEVFIDYDDRLNKTVNIQDNDKITRDGFNRKTGVQVSVLLDKWRFSPRYEYRNEEEKNEVGTKTKGITTHSPSLKIYVDVTAKDFVIPLIGLHLKNRLVIDSLIKYERKSGIENKRDNTDTYSADVNCTYDTSENLKITLGIGGTSFKNRKQEEDNYWSISLSADLSIIF